MKIKDYFGNLIMEDISNLNLLIQLLKYNKSVQAHSGYVLIWASAPPNIFFCPTKNLTAAKPLNQYLK